MKFKIGELVLVVKGEHKGLKGHVNNILDDMVFVVRIQEDLNKGLIPVMGNWNENDLMKIYSDDELRYAAISRCECGAGLAYPKEPINIHGSWECSDILTGRAELDHKVTHTSPLPFMFYEIKSEDQPSAFGATTRSSKTTVEIKSTDDKK